MGKSNKLLSFAVALIQPVLYSGTDSKIKSLADEYLKKSARLEHFSGSVVIVQDSKIVLSKGYNFANREFNVENDPHTKFRITSLSKAFTAVAILQLQEKGHLHVNDTLKKYLKDYPNGDRITIHNLLTHSSGIFNVSNLPNFKDLKKIPTNLEQSIALFKDEPLIFTPGSKHEYSNSNYFLLSYIIEKVSGKTYEEYIQEHIFTPLGMKHSGLDNNKTILKNRAWGYSKNNGELECADYIDMSWPKGNGGLYSTVEDLFLWDQALYTEKLLSKESIQLMFAPYGEINNVSPQAGYCLPVHYGYGWVIGKVVNKNCVGHIGRINGFATDILRFIDDKITIIVLSNFEHTATDKIVHDLASFFFK
jgi:CubicO group peptidase (beta-lactamase class C family)